VRNGVKQKYSGYEWKRTAKDVVESALSEAFEDVGIRISDTRWDQLCKAATARLAKFIVVND
jgi:ABC-type uncharacterized transport system auxiliary subunit